MDFSFLDNSDEIKTAMTDAAQRALETCGLKAEGYAKKLVNAPTGRLRNSISHTVKGKDVYIGSNVEYAPYVELGTGVHYPGGRNTPWVYQDEKGNWHRTTGQEAQPYLKPAVADHAAEYRRIMENTMKGK